MHSVNIWAVLGATVAVSIAGGLWYSPLLFAKIWMRECGVDENACRGRNAALLIGAAVVLNFVTALVFAICIGPNPGVLPGLQAGLVVGIFWVGFSIGMNYLFEGRSLKLFAITAGAHVLRFALIGLVLGLWN